jgi:outer membrane receptor for ferrienterochelin and colicin
VSAHGELVGKRWFPDNDGDGNRERADRYAWFGARAEFELTDYLSLFGGVDNIADAGDSQFLPIAPRAFYAGLRGRYESPDPPPRLARP